MKKPRIVLAFAFAFLIALRIIIDSFEGLTLVVAMINVASLLVVVFDIAENLKKSILLKIKDKIPAKSIAKREKEKFLIWFYAVLIAVCSLFSVLYIALWHSNLGNDILSVVALMVSFLDDEIIALGTFLYKV